MKACDITFIDIKAKDNREIGYEIGRALKDRIHDYWDWLFKLYEARTDLDTLADIAKETELYTQRYFPKIYTELAGLAQGAEIDMQKIALICDEEMIMHHLEARCTTVAIAQGGATILGHNEDWAPGYEECLYVVRVRNDECAFLSLAYIGTLPGTSVALNSHGIAFSGNSILRGSQDGVPKSVILRSQIEAQNLREFVTLAVAKGCPRALPNHTMALNARGNIVSIELSLNKVGIFWARGTYVHTNHLVHKKMEGIELLVGPRSQKRYETALKYLRENEPGADLVKMILRSHDQAPHSICAHASADNYHKVQTVASAIVDPKNFSLSVALGNPCLAEYKTFYLYD